MVKHINLKYTFSGHIFIRPEDDCHATVDAMLETGYNEEFCIADSFDSEFIARLMEAGFLVMSINLAKNEGEGAASNGAASNGVASNGVAGNGATGSGATGSGAENCGAVTREDYILLPKLHLERSVLFFENLHIKKSIRRLLNRYELIFDAEFDRIIDRCVSKHGNDWLTPPLVECIKKLHTAASRAADCRCESSASLKEALYPSSFALYREGELVAGEFGVICGKVYTSYSGFYDEDNAGTAQLILAARYLQEHGFTFFDLGMPMDYKTALGAINVYPEEFVGLFRSAL